MYHIVDFLDTGDSEVVPSSWVKDGRSLWPPFKVREKCNRVVVRGDPPDESWPSHTIRIRATKTTEMQTNYPHTLEVPDVSGFPLTSLNELAKLEESIAAQGDIYRRKLVTYFGLAGGLTVKESVWRIMTKLMTNRLAKQINWRGLNGKYAFEQLVIKDVVLIRIDASNKVLVYRHIQLPGAVEDFTGQPPSKSAGGTKSEDRALYDKWRASQYALRADYLVGYFSLRRPSATKVARLIGQEGWTTNCPKAEEVVSMWKPASKQKVETDPYVHHCVAEQAWTGLAIKDFGPPKGLGVVATRNFASGDIVCDYHGNVITASEGRSIMEDLNGEAGCHPLIDTFGRRINHSSKSANVKPIRCKMTFNRKEKDIVLFKALKNITVDEELKVDYGINRKSF
ncbi:uncharacterized protein LOC130102073 [Rhinichthys klamathensis goyatoka]|uniref:uncharacterized protein LOC130102073 n=1 Tax=Rhinichthys klamathensis goyatoka TaxID=3034132 RepID=UPI0024B4D2BC|nr:uncharacterized protein LOC130102073 [Rhinichthys klamathensis goyatoka]